MTTNSFKIAFSNGVLQYFCNIYLSRVPGSVSRLKSLVFFLFLAKNCAKKKKRREEEGKNRTPQLLPRFARRKCFTLYHILHLYCTETPERAGIEILANGQVRVA